MTLSFPRAYTLGQVSGLAAELRGRNTVGQSFLLEVITMPKRATLLVVLAVLLFAHSLLRAQDTNFSPKDEQIPGPDKATTSADQCCYRSNEIKDPTQGFQTWLEDVRHWRTERRIRIGYEGSEYARPELKLTQSSFIQPQMMIEDRYFYDPVAGKYTVDR